MLKDHPLIVYSKKDGSILKIPKWIRINWENLTTRGVGRCSYTACNCPLSRAGRLRVGDRTR